MPKTPSIPNAVDALKQREWTAVEVATLLDVPVQLVDRWCRVHVLPARSKHGQWRIDGAALFLFCSRRIEPHYSPITIAGLLDRRIETVRDWIKSRRLKTVKLGSAKSATVLVAESELRRWMAL